MFATPLADAIAAIAVLKPDLEDRRSRRAIAQLLGVNWQPPADFQEPAAPAIPRSVQATHSGEAAAGATFESAVRVAIEPPAADVLPVPFEVRVSLPPPANTPRWLEEIEPLPRPAAHPGPTLSEDPPPLFVPEWTRSILTTAVTFRERTGPLDIPQILETICGGEAVDGLPRLERRTVANGVRLLIDRSDAMLPFAADVKWLEERFRNTFGESSIQILRFAACPTRGMGTAGRLTWKHYDQWLPPRPRTAVVVVSDLGIVAAPQRRLPGQPAEWLRLANDTRAAGCPLVAIVPFGKDRWPEELVRHIPIIPWDRATTASGVRNLAGRAPGTGMR